MSKVLIFNSGDCTINAGGKLVPAGSQRHIEASEITPGIKKYVVKPTSHPSCEDSSGDETPAFSPEAFLDRNLREIEEDKFNGLSLDDLDIDQLQALKDTETAAENRKGALEAIDSALLALSMTMG